MTTEMLQFEIVKRVTVPFLIISDDGLPVYLKFDSAIEPDKSTFSERVRKAKSTADGQKPNEQPMHIATVTNVQTGEVLRLVAHEVLENTLNESYKDQSYVGKIFEIKKTKKAGKRYFSFDVTEIKLKTTAPAANVAQAKK